MVHWLVTKAGVDAAEPNVKAWLGRLLIVNTTLEEDRKLNVDLICLGGDISWHGRWRYSQKGHDNFASYFREFTIRSWRPNLPGEKDKILDGLGDWWFYCWLDNETRQVLCGTLIDLKRLKDRIHEMPSTPEQDNIDEGQGSADSRWQAYWIKHAAERGCLIDFRFADESELVGGVKLPGSKWRREQFVKMLKPHFQDLTVAARRARRI
jgi:hypothetical protein